MAYCRKCGAEIDDEAVICPKCGVPQKNVGNVVEEVDLEAKADTGLLVLSVLVPLAGIIFGCINLSKKPNAAKTYFIAAAISFVIAFFIFMGF